MPPENTAVMDALSEAVLDTLRKKGINLGAKHTTPSGTPTTNYMHGPGGIFGVEGLEQTIISTRIQPRGLLGSLAAIGTIKTNPLYGYITGFETETGTVADGVCDDPEVAGPVKSCIQTAQFGRYSFMTKEIELNRLGQQINRGEFLDLQVLNPPLLQTEGALLEMGSVPGMPDLRREVEMAFTAVGVSFQNRLMQQVWTGNPANNSAGGGSTEFPGLDILIGTNKVDAITGTNCPSLDSDIKDFNYGLVDEVSNGTDIVEVLTYMNRILRHTADRTRMNPVTWAIVMREALFYEVTAVWPCSYLTYRCTFRDAAGQDRLVVNANDQVTMRDQMRTEQYLLIDGLRIPVILDDGIVEETDADNVNILAGQFASDIYMVPMTARAGFATTFMQYLDYSQGAMLGVQDGRLQGDFWTDGGRFLWHKKPPLNWCNQWLGKIEPRVILLTPHLAGRVQNVRYDPLQHPRDPFPDDSYFVDGGETSRVGPSLFSDWNLP